MSCSRSPLPAIRKSDGLIATVEDDEKIRSDGRKCRAAVDNVPIFKKLSMSRGSLVTCRTPAVEAR